MASSTTMSMAGLLNTVFSKADHKQGPLSIVTCKNSKIRCNPNLKFGPAIRLPKYSQIRASKDQEPDLELHREVIGMTVKTRTSGDEVTERISKVVIEKQFVRPSAQNGENLGFRKEDENIEGELPRETLTHLASESAVEEPIQVHKEASEEAKHIAPKVGKSVEDVAEKLEEKVEQISETEARIAGPDTDDHMSVTEPEDEDSKDDKWDETRTGENNDSDRLGEAEFRETGDYGKPGGIFSGVKQSGEFAKQGLTSGKEALEKRARGFSEASQEAKEKTNMASDMAKKGWESVVHSVEAAQEGMSKLVEQVQKTAGEQIKAVTGTLSGEMDEEAKKGDQAKQGKVDEESKKHKQDNEDPHRAVQYEFHEMRTGEKDYNGNDNDIDLDDGDDDDDDDFNLPGEDDSMPRPSSISDRAPHHDDSPGLDVDLGLGDLEDKTTKPSFVQSAEIEQP